MALPFTLTPDEIIGLPVNALALRVLENFRDDGGSNYYNWLLEQQQHVGITGEALDACAEAWQWLQSHGLVAQQPGQTSPQAVFITRAGYAALDEGLDRMRAAERIGVDLHPLLRDTVERQFLLGEYELGAFAAMKQVEVRVRQLGGYENRLIGVPLMRKAFNEGGVLRDSALEGGEQNAIADLFAGAIGTFKNPVSHRPVDYVDVTIAAEVVLLADLLLRMLDRYGSMQRHPSRVRRS